MNVAVLYKRGQRRAGSTARGSILGDGLLDRARSTSLALLGATAAVGLAMVAMVFNQDWPLIPGAPIPGRGDKEQAVGDAAVAAKGKASSGPVVRTGQTVARRDSNAFARPQDKGPGGTPAPVDSQSPSAESIVVSNSTPVGSSADSSPGGSSPTQPGSQQTVTTPTQAAPPAVTPTAPPPSPVASASAPPSQAPVSSGSAPPPESSEGVDEDDDADEDCPPEEEEPDEDYDHSHGWYRGHGHGHW